MVRGTGLIVQVKTHRERRLFYSGLDLGINCVLFTCGWRPYLHINFISVYLLG
jgi:hypothetical protein